jgi:hypothetical protein
MNIMTLDELKEYLAKSILRRPELYDDDDVILSTAIQIGHKQVQIDGDFRCMEEHCDIHYPANGTDGVEIPDPNYKKSRFLWAVSSDGVKTPIMASSEDAVNNMEMQASQSGQSAYFTPDLVHQRWYEREMKIYLLFPPSERTKLTLGYYKYLPSPTQDEDEDYLMRHLWLMIVNAAAWQGSINLWQDDRADKFLSIYTALRNQAIQSEKVAKQGGAYRVYRPPSARGRKW